MSDPVYVYALIAIPAGYVLGSEIKNKATKETIEQYKAEWAIFEKTIDYSGYMCGPTTRALLSGEQREEYIKGFTQEQDMYSFHEGWYDYIVIEKHTLGVIDDITHLEDDDKAELWMKWNNEKSAYDIVEKPNVLMGTIRFIG